MVTCCTHVLLLLLQLAKQIAVTLPDLLALLILALALPPALLLSVDGSHVFYETLMQPGMVSCSKANEYITLGVWA